MQIRKYLQTNRNHYSRKGKTSITQRSQQPCPNYLKHIYITSKSSNMAPSTPPPTESSSIGATTTPRTELRHSKSMRYVGDHTPQRSMTPQRVLKLRTPPSSHHHKSVEENVSSLSKYIGSARKTRHKIESLANLVDSDYQELLAEPGIFKGNISPRPVTTGLGINDTESLASLDLHLQVPRTPDQKVQRNSVQTPPPLMTFPEEESHEEETIIRKARLENPFVETGSISSMKLVNPFVDSPFNKSEKSSGSNKNNRQVDYNTTMELYDKRTGKYIEKELLEEAKKFKPQRLTFTEENQQLNNNYLANRMTVDFHRKKKHLGFQIFEDGEHRQ